MLSDLTDGSLVRVNIETGSVQERPGSSVSAVAVAVSPNGRFYAVGRVDGTISEYDARTLRLVRTHVVPSGVLTLFFSPDSRELAVLDNSSVLHVWDTCNIFENATALARLTAKESVRPLTAGERATFGVGESG
jgi:WD40 repeat protein